VRTAHAGVVALALALGTPPAAAEPEKSPQPRVVFVGADDGPLAQTAEESFAGFRAALEAAGAVATREAPAKAGAHDAHFADMAKRGVSAVAAFVPDGAAAALEKAAERAGLPLLVLSPEPTRPDLDPARAVFWAGGLTPTDEALFAMDFLLQPLSVQAPAIYHDGSARAAEAAAKCARMAHATQTPRAPEALPADFGVSDVKGVLGRHASAAAAEATSAGGGCDGIVYFGGPAGAERLLAACVAAKVEAPVLLGQGLVSRAVPSFAEGRAASAWALEPQYFEDYVHGKGSPAPDDAAAVAEAAKAVGGRALPATTRGYRAGRWVAEALFADGPEKKREKRFLASLRRLAREGARGRPVFEEWGWASLARFEAWHAAKWRDEAPCTRARPTYMPISGIPQVGFFSASRFRWEPGSVYVWMHWGSPEERTIEKDLAALGLDPGAYEAGFREKILDDLMGRTISRLNRLFFRNADGTAIPGVSFNITFGTEKDPKGLKSGSRFEMVLRGDHPFAGGIAHGTSCEVFTTFIRRTLYADKALKPAIRADDHRFVNGSYRWATSLDENLRGDFIRSLQDGYTQGFALTGAHECGHMFGCGHDTVTPRSIMNVAEAVGLDFEWAEWVPEHLKILTNRLERVPARK
jgi:hypothetical protein